MRLKRGGTNEIEGCYDRTGDSNNLPHIMTDFTSFPWTTFLDGLSARSPNTDLMDLDLLFHSAWNGFTVFTPGGWVDS